jgi:LppX/LprAFG-like lipoprotein
MTGTTVSPKEPPDPEVTMPRRALLLLLPILALTLAACGGGGSMSLDPVASAATKTVDAQTFTTDFTATVKVLGRSFSFGGNGAVDLGANATSLTMDLSGIPLPQGSAGQGGAGTVDIVFANGIMYLRMPMLASKLPSGKTWLKLDVQKLAAAKGFDLGSFKNVDPSQVLAQLQAAGDVQKVGTETIQGAETTHYHAVIDVAKSPNLTDKQRAAIQKALGGADRTVPVDVWIDSDGHVRRETTSFSFGKGLQGAQMAMTMNFSDFGQPVTVTVPSADRVQDITALAAKPAAPRTATTAWAQQATPICSSIVHRAQAVVPKRPPHTFAARAAFVRAIVPYEEQELAQLQAIGAAPNAAEQQALAALRSDLAEAHTALASAADRAAFTKAYATWAADHRTSKAFSAAGVTGCAG